MNTSLDSDLLRTFLAVADAGSLTAGAARIFRSQSAASVQIRQLEDVLGRRVFDRHGRGVVLTAAGERLRPMARQIVRTLDLAQAEIGGGGLEGALRVGVPDDHGQEALVRILAAFARDHPRVELTVRCALSTGFPKALASGDMDMAIHEVDRIGPRMEMLRADAPAWVMPRGHDLLARDPLPLAVFDHACWWRDAALRSAEASGRRTRIVYSSESVTGIAAAIEAGIAVGVLGPDAMTPAMATVPRDAGFGPLPASSLVLERSASASGPVCDAMAAAIHHAMGNG